MITKTVNELLNSNTNNPDGYTLCVNEWPSTGFTANFHPNIPVTIWLPNEVAYVGLTEQAARARYELTDSSVQRVGVALCSYSSTVKYTVQPRDGFVKLVFMLDGGRLLGVHQVGAEASEMIHFGATLVNQRQTLFDVVKEVMAGVTFQQAYKIAARVGCSMVSDYVKSFGSRL